jgi:drug/metabolite transporter (DMT)-like permease
MKTKLWTALIALYIVWGSTYLAMRFVVETIPPFLYAAIRFLIAGAILYYWRRAAGDEKPTRSNWKATAIAGTLLLLGGNAMIALAEKHVPSGIAALMVGTSPFWMTLFEALRPHGTKPTWQTSLGLVVGFIGMFLLIGPANVTWSGSNVEPVSLIAMCAAPMLWALGSIYARGADMPKSGLMATGMEMLASAAPLFLVSAATGELRGFSFGDVSMRSWLGMAYLITFGSLVGFVSYSWLLHNAPLSLTSTFAYVNPVVAVFLGYLLGDEVLEPHAGVAAGIIVGAVMLINIKIQPRVKKEALEVSLEKA